MYHEASIIPIRLDGRDLCFESSRIGEQSPQQCKGTWQDSFLDHVTTPKISGSVGLQQNIQSSSLSKGWSNFKILKALIFAFRSPALGNSALLGLLLFKVGWADTTWVDFSWGPWYVKTLGFSSTWWEFSYANACRFLLMPSASITWNFPCSDHVFSSLKAKDEVVSKNIAKINMLNQCCKLPLSPYWVPCHGVSKNRGTQKWMVYNGKPY